MQTRKSKISLKYGIFSDKRNMNTKMIRYKDELYDELFTRTSDLPKHIQSQPLLKLNHDHVDITKALPNSLEAADTLRQQNTQSHHR